MKNKYQKFFKENEKKYYKKSLIKMKILLNKYYMHVISKNGFEGYKLVRNNKLNHVCISLSLMDDYWQNYILNEIIYKMSKESIMMFFIKSLTTSTLSNNKKIINVIIDSFIKTDFIKNVNFNENEKWFELETNDDEIIKFGAVHDSKESMLSCKKKCHAVTQYIIEHLNSKEEIFGVTAIMEDCVGSPYYHSFIVKNNIAYDYAQNIVMLFEDYKKLFNCNVIMMANGNQILNDIEKLELGDPEFKKNKCYAILKYAAHKQMTNTRQYS